MPRGRRRRKLADVEVTSLGLVRHGANRRYWAISKQQQEEALVDENEVVQAVLEAELDEAVAKKLPEGLEGPAAAAAEAVAKILHAFAEELDPSVVAATIEATGLVEKARGEPPDEGSDEGSDGDSDGDSIPPAAVALLKSLKRRADEAEQRTAELAKELAAERERRQREDTIQVAKSRWAAAGRPEELADLVLGVEKLDGEDGKLAEKLRDLLERVSSRIAHGDLLSVKGRFDDGREPDDLDPAAEALRAATELAKSDGNGKGDGAALQDALQEVFRKDPGLYWRYRAGSGAGR